MKRGFTLVELAIVLVIIGLLIGGILAAQSMINAAKIQTFVRQVQQFDVAVSNFKTKYKGLPGDTTIMGCTDYGSGNVCDNGWIQDYNNGGNQDASGGAATQFFQGEALHFWPDLGKSGFAPNINFLSTAPGTNFSVQTPN